MNWDRFDICEAYYCFATDWHGGQTDPIYKIFGRLHKIGFKPSPHLGQYHLDRLTENGREIYENLKEKRGFK